MNTTEELGTELAKIRRDREPTKRGIMLLSAFLGGLMMNAGRMNEEQMDSMELLFWISHNGDGTPIIPNHRPK